MIVTKLELENWMKIQQLTLEFKPGINLIYGPNEIGKSSIMRAVRLGITGDAGSGGRDYKMLRPWGTDVKSKVNLSFTTRDGKNYSVRKSFPRGEADLYLKTVKLSGDAKRTQEKIYRALDVPPKAGGLFDLLFIDQGKALDIFDKEKISMNEDTKSHIKNVIRETAVRSLQEFQESLNRERETLFTNPGMKKFKSGKNAPEYILLLQKERELSEQLAEREEKAGSFSLLLEEMENLDKEIDRASREKKKKEKSLAALKTKKKQLEELEKKKLEYNPIGRDYKRSLEIEEKQAALDRELPALYARAKKIITALETEINRGKEKANQIRRRRAALKAKKKESEGLAEFKRGFEELRDRYHELCRVKKDLLENDKNLFALFLLNREKLEKEAREVQSEIDLRLKKQAQLEAIDRQLKDYPKMTREEIDHVKKISDKIDKLQNRVNAARSAVKMTFKITPLASKEIRFNLEVDQGESTSHAETSPMEVGGFHRLNFLYPDVFDIDISGRPAEVDIGALQKQCREKQTELTRRLGMKKVETIEALDNKFREYTDLNSRKTELKNQLEQLPPLLDLQNRETEINTHLRVLDRDIEKHPHKETARENGPIDETERNRPSRVPGDELIKAKTGKEHLTARLNAILKDRTFEEVEKEFPVKEKQYRELRDKLAKMEPVEIEAVTQEHIDTAAEELSVLEKTTGEKEKDKHLLESMEGWEEFREGGVDIAPLSSSAQSPRQTREAINKNRTQSGELREQKKGLLNGKAPGDFKREYLEKKNVVDILIERISTMAPIDMNSLEDIGERIGTLERAVSDVTAEIDARRSRKAGLSGEIKGFGDIMEEKDRLEYTRGKALEEIKTRLIDIYALKLLLKVIEEEKEKAQREIFKPLAEQVVQRFEQLVPGKYEVDIDNRLGLSISGRGPAGGKQEGVNESLSFGTREQLSFLVRLAIAGQLSQKEPQVMLLDDSFVNSDTHRLSHLLEMIGRSSKEIQFLIFTCKERDYLQYKETFHTINLEELI